MGNYDPREVRVSVIGDGCYIVREEDGDSLIVPSPHRFEDFEEWMLNMDDTELEAALQIYMDRWTFQTGAEYDKLALEALERERDRRKQSNSTFAPGIFR